MSNFTCNAQSAKQYGTHEIVLTTRSGFSNPYLDLELHVTFVRPDGSEVTTDGFFDGGDTFRARAYCDMVGEWEWRSVSSHPDLSNMGGSFTVIPSLLKGKLRIHPEDPYQFAYANGDWFLHIGDTGYRYVVDEEVYWREYLEQAVASGITKIRTWFCRGRSDVQALFEHDQKRGRNRLNLTYWQEMDRRLIYALNHYPQVIFQLIPFGEDGIELKRYGDGDSLSHYMVRYAQARFSALPNIHWCISNDHEIVMDDDIELEQQQEGNPRVRRDHIEQIGRDMAAREPWGTLLTNHQMRFSGFSFLDSSWNDIVTLEDLGQVTGRAILDYREKAGMPVVLDEDRYETWRPPKHDRYFFRRLFWGCLLSGGHATYGGLRTFEPYDGDQNGLYGYYDACSDGRLENGAHDLRYIREFFRKTGLTLVNMVPADEVVGDKPLLYKALRNESWQTFIVYIANPDIHEGHDPQRFSGRYTDEEADEDNSVPEVRLNLPVGDYSMAWFDPGTGEWSVTDESTKGQDSVAAPGEGDWVLLVSKKG